MYETGEMGIIKRQGYLIVVVKGRVTIGSCAKYKFMIR